MIRPTVALALAITALAAFAGPAQRTLLFVDDHDILYRAGTHRVFHPFIRYSGNPVIPGGATPWEGEIAWMSIHRQSDTGRYQIWYQAWSGDVARDRTRRCVVCYAESPDGIRFTKPDLGLFDYNGDRHNSIVLIANGGTHDRYGASVLYDPRATDPARRYKMAYYDFNRADDGVERPGLCVAFSPDGIHWTKVPHAPLIPTYYGGANESIPFPGDRQRPWSVPMTMSDALDAMYDAPRHVFAIYGKSWIDGPDGTMGWKHGMARVQSRDFVHWSQPQIVLTPDDEDPDYVEFHTAPVFYYDDCYFGLLQILHRAVGNGVIDVELALSRDGFGWQRPFRHTLALPRSAPGHFDSGSLFPCSTPVVLPDEIRFYYGAYSGGATSGDDTGMKSGIGFATVRRDRFAGIRPVAHSDQPTLAHPLENIGQITLRPLALDGNTRLSLNVDASRGSARVELLDSRGYRVPGFTESDAIPIRGDALRAPVRWRRPIGELPAGNYLIRIHLDRAEAFALTVEAGGP